MGQSMAEAYLILDAGTGAGRALVVDAVGRVRSAAYREWSFRQEQDVAGAVYYDARELENALWDCASRALHGCDREDCQIKAVAVAALREGVVFLDGRGRELYVGPSFDDRAVAEGNEIAERIGRETYFKSGTYPGAGGFAARLAWFRHNRPSVYREIRHVLTLGDWINYLLCEETFSEPSLASASGLLDILEGDWSGKLVAALGVKQDWLPPVRRSGQKAGRLRRDVSTRLGLAEGTVVVVGGGDTQCALLGMGLVDEWMQGCVAGSTSPIQQITGHPVFDNQMRTWTNCQLDAGKYGLESNAIATGLAYRWLRDFLGHGLDYEGMDTLAETAAPGSQGVLAFLGAEIMHASRSQASCMGGFLFPVPPTCLRPADFVRAFLESHAYAVRANIEQIEAITGREGAELHICGGLSASRIGMEILSAVLQRPVHVHPGPCSALGAAMCAAVGVQSRATLRLAASDMAGASTSVEPGGEHAAFYEDRFGEWKARYQQPRQMGDRPSGG